MSWLGFNTSVSGMMNSQRKLYTVNHNVNNAEREGYSRQKVNSSANIPLHIAGQGYIGTGIGIDSIERVRDIYLDKKFRTETSSFGTWDMKMDGLTEIEGVLRGSHEEGINVNMDEFFKSIEDLSTNPTDMAYRTSFRQRVVSLTETMNETVKRLYQQQKSINFEVKTKIKEVNDYSEQIATINSEIFAMEVDGSNANDLRDQRDLLVDKLSKLVDVQAEERTVNVEESKDGKSIEIKKFEVRIGGMSIIDHDMVSKLKYPPDRVDNPLNPEEPLYKVEWASGGEVILKSGEIRGLLEVRDGGHKIEVTNADGDKKLVDADSRYSKANGIPYYIDKLDEFAQVIFVKINEIHLKGTDLNGDNGNLLFGTNDTAKNEEIKNLIKDSFELIKNGPPKLDGYPTTDDYDDAVVQYNINYGKYQDALKEASKLVRSDNITISEAIKNDLNAIATIDGTIDKEDIENNGILLEIIAAREQSDFFGDGAAYQGRPEDYFTSLLSTLGTDKQQATRMQSIQNNIVKQATNQKLSVSGVNLDEEMADMVKFQQIFNASAKMVTTFDQIFDTVVNRLGMVGR